VSKQPLSVSGERPAGFGKGGSCGERGSGETKKQERGRKEWEGEDKTGYHACMSLARKKGKRKTRERGREK
jgi:hypothetical protein